MTDHPNQRTVRKRAQEAVEAVQAARQEWPEIKAMAESIRGDARLSENYRAQKLAETVGSWRSTVVGGLEQRAGRLYAERDQANQRLEELREVAPEVMSARAAVLSPVLGKVDTDPEALLGAYRARFEDLADRQLLEDSAALVQQSFSGPNYPGTSAFGERWKALQNEMAPYLPEAEKEVIAAGESFGETAGYLEAATRMLDMDLAELSGENPNVQNMTTREYSRVAVQRFENAAQEALQDQGAEASGTAA